jgi:phosphate transport system substrate-binding protein
LNTVFQPVKSSFESATGIMLIALQSSPKGGLVKLLVGKVNIAVGAHSLVESMNEGATKDGVSIDPAALEKHQVGVNRTVLFV